MKQNKLLIDIKHPAQLNLFKNLAIDLKNENWDITICYLQRGKIPKIIEKEFQGFHTIPVGSSKGTKWSIIWNGNIVRILTFLKLIFQNKYNICISASSVPLALACKLTNTPILQFYDDPERKSLTKINAFLSTKIYFPFIVEQTDKIEVFNCLKEWSYLSPKRINPSTKVLQEYNLEKHNYVFVREVSNKSFNYYGQDDSVVLSFADKIDKTVKIVLSLEDKSIKDKFPNDWILLEVPVSDIHALIYYSKLVISSGDSMAREGAMLGVPSIYCGFREMKANNVLIKKGILVHKTENEAIEYINQKINSNFEDSNQVAFRSQLAEEWDDMIDFMKQKINAFKK